MMHGNKVFVDVDDKSLKGLSLGDEVTVVTKGTICEMRHREDYEMMPCGCMGGKKEKSKEMKEEEKMRKKHPSSVGVKVESVKLNGKNAYEELDKDEE